MAKDEGRARPEMIMFFIGLLLFGGGLASVIVRQLSPDAPPESPDVVDPSVDANAGKIGRIGPSPGEAVVPYIERKKELLKTRSSREASKKTLAVVVFENYLKPAEVDTFIATNRLNASLVQLRIPAPAFKPVEVDLKGKPVAQAVEGEIGAGRLAELKEELKQLESLLADTKDPDFVEVYKQDADAHRQGVEILTKNPTTVYGIVVEASNSALGKLASVRNVRLVDLPDDPPGSRETHVFAAILPEDKQTAGFAA